VNKKMAFNIDLKKENQEDARRFKTERLTYKEYVQIALNEFYILSYQDKLSLIRRYRENASKDKN